jgi:glycerol-3-phosphate acyltransferase PlsX
MTEPLSIAVDAMSGDHGADVAVPAALDVLAGELSLRLILVGRADAITGLLPAGRVPERCSIVEAREVVGMDERPQEAVRRKKDSSMRVALNLVESGAAAACVSAGNTGALLATARFVLGMIQGVDRPAIVSSIPAVHGHTMMLDLGANPDCTADHLVQFAAMGAVLSSDLHGLTEPRVGLLNIGEEDIKGTEELREAHRRLGIAPINYCGFVEGDDIFSGDVDVVVTDGFAGNVALKTSEGLARFISGAMREEFTRGPVRKLAALAATPAQLQRRKHGRARRHRHQEPRRRRPPRIRERRPGGDDRGAQRRSGAHRGDAGTLRRRRLQRAARRGFLTPGQRRFCFAAALRRCIRSTSWVRRRSIRSRAPSVPARAARDRDCRKRRKSS